MKLQGLMSAAIVLMVSVESPAAVYVVAQGDTVTESLSLGGSGGVTKQGGGTLVLTNANSFAGAVLVEGGTLELAGPSGNAAGSAASFAVANESTLLITLSGQASDAAPVTLSGGTIRIGGGSVSETFGALTLTNASFLDFGASSPGVLRFASYSPEYLLTVNNFLPGNKLRFGEFFPESAVDDSGLFSFSGQFITGTEDGAFTITAIPEPGGMLLAASGLVLCLSRHRRRA